MIGYEQKNTSLLLSCLKLQFLPWAGETRTGLCTKNYFDDFHAHRCVIAFTSVSGVDDRVLVCCQFWALNFTNSVS